MSGSFISSHLLKDFRVSGISAEFSKYFAVYERSVVQGVINDSVVNSEQGYVQISACEGKEAIRWSQIKQRWCNERIAYRSWLELENQSENGE